MTPTTAPFATHNRRVQRTTAGDAAPTTPVASRLSPRLHVVSLFHTSTRTSSRVVDCIVHVEHTALPERAEPDQSRRLSQARLHFHVPPLALRRRHSASNHRQFLAQFLARKQESGRPARLFFGRVAERQQTPNHGTSRCGKATADSVNSDPLTHLPKRLSGPYAAGSAAAGTLQKR